MSRYPTIAAALLLFAAPADAQRAGQLISADPVVETPAGMQAWRIRYWTRTDRNVPRQVTGMVVAPREAIPPRPRQIVAWTHGAWGVARQCAPSLSPNFWNISAGLEGVRRGYTVVAPDYPGLGADGVHPFLVGVDTGRSVLDAVRATRSIPGAAAGNRFALWGESQGGHAALWAGQIARSYAPDLRLVGVAAAAPPTDLVENLRQISNKPVRTLFTAYIGDSWSRHYEVPLATLSGPQGRGIITRLARNNCIQFDRKPKFGTIAGIAVLQLGLGKKDLGAIQPWARLARGNSPTTVSFGVPMLFAQNKADDLVAASVTRRHAQALCRSGARLRYLPDLGTSHMDVAKASTKQTLDWIADRFAGRPTPSDCGRF